MALSCVAVLSRSNSPLLVISDDPARALADQYSLHTSLDVIEERLGPGFATGNAPTGGSTTNTPAKSSAASLKAGGVETVVRDSYLGALFSTERQKVFGYVTNTGIKFILIADLTATSSSVAFRDNEIRHIFRKLHLAYSQLLSNPFYSPGEPIKSPRFEGLVRGILNNSSK